MFENATTLNLVSLVGLFSMIGIAWLLSSHKSKVNWKLVAWGLGLQLLLAGVLFQSQNWTTSQTFNGFGQILTAVKQNEVTPAQVNAAMAANEFLAPFESFEKLAEQRETGGITDAQIDNAFRQLPEGLEVERYPNGILFAGVESFFAAINNWVNEGSVFVFKSFMNPNDPTTATTNPLVLLGTFAFGVLPTVIFFAALMSILYHIGLMQRLIKVMAWVMQRTLGTSGAESMAAAANVMVGHTEAPLVVKPFVGAMTRSELNALMVGGFATISGSLMAVFVAKGISAGHLLTASIISAPAALVIAKVMQPETETPQTLGEATKDEPEKVATNVIEAAAIGASEGMKLAINIAAMLIAFLALLAMINAIIVGFGELIEWLVNMSREEADRVNFNWTLNNLFGTLFYPLAWIMGIEATDCATSGQLLGKKMVVNEFVAYLDMGSILAGDVSVVATDGTKQVVTLSERTQIILTYALAGFSNFGAIGIQIGGIGPLAPERRGDLAQLGLRAMFGGMLACCMTACVAGAMYGILR